MRRSAATATPPRGQRTLETFFAAPSKRPKSAEEETPSLHTPQQQILAEEPPPLSPSPSPPPLLQQPLAERLSRATPPPPPVAVDAPSSSPDVVVAAAAAPSSPTKALAVSGFSTRDLHPYRFQPLMRRGGGGGKAASSQRFQQQQQQQQKTVAAAAAEAKARRKRRLQQSREALVQLSPDQQRVVDAALSGESFFFTGKAGTGKSLALRRIVAALQAAKGDSAVFVTASTGVAACNIGGTTLHSFAGVGLGKEPAHVLAAKVRVQAKARARWMQAEVLVVDEISMLSGELFDKLDFIGRHVRSTDAPFGGVQLVLCGDYFQLPPVFDRDSGDHLLCFEAKAWPEAIKRSYMLTHVFRQADPTFVALLNEVRDGALSPGSWEMLEHCRRTVFASEDGIEPTRLFPHRDVVDRLNSERLGALQGEEHVYSAIDTANNDTFSRMLDNTQAPAKLSLRIGAQVILLRNLDFTKELVNGTLGIVMGFEPHDEDPDGEVFPVVRFRNGKKMTMKREEWPIEVGGIQVAMRRQVPLNLAWALSIHKSQGMTLAKVEMSLEHVFAEGQAYVALSRVTALQGLKIVGKLPHSRAFTPNPSVVRFYRDLEQQQQQQQQTTTTT